MNYSAQMKIRRERLKKEGRCTICGKINDTQHTRCKKCLWDNKMACRRRYHRLKAASRCHDCTKKTRKDRLLCGRCQLKQNKCSIRGRNECIIRRLKDRLRSRLYCSIRYQRLVKGVRKYVSHIRGLGCTVVELMAHLEKQFQPDMTWENYGSWHIDHIKALATCDLANEEEQKKAVHYTNLQPLWAADNIRKGIR